MQGKENILTYLRHGNTIASMPLAMDSLNYNYKTGNNQLAQVLDAVPATNYPNDIHNETSNRNYQYNAIGQLAKDSAGKIDTIIWNVYGKVKEIIMQSPSSALHKDSILFDYDPFGNRLEKRSYKTLLTCMSCLPMFSTDTTIYVKDGEGNIMAIYDRQKKKVHLTEWDIYGQKRIGVVDTGLMVYGTRPISTHDTTILDSSTISYLEGQKQYELVNHLGNVLVTVSDKKTPVDTNFDMLADYYQPNIITSQDYYPHGMQIPGRTYQILYYNFNFSGKYKDDEVYGKSNEYDFGNRIYDPRIGRFMSRDPLAMEYTALSPYNYCANNPLFYVDRDGKKILIYYNDKNGLAHVYEYGSNLPLPDNDFLKNAVLALDYIAHGGNEGQQLIYDLVCTDKTINLTENDKTPYWDKFEGSEYRDAQGNTNFPGGNLLWNPLMSLAFKDGTSISPAVALTHELGHAWQAFSHPNDFANDKFDPMYVHSTDKFTEENYEHPIAKYYGEGIRYNHDWFRFTYNISPITTEEPIGIPVKLTPSNFQNWAYGDHSNPNGGSGGTGNNSGVQGNNRNNNGGTGSSGTGGTGSGGTGGTGGSGTGGTGVNNTGGTGGGSGGGDASGGSGGNSGSGGCDDPSWGLDSGGS